MRAGGEVGDGKAEGERGLVGVAVEVDEAGAALSEKILAGMLCGELKSRKQECLIVQP